MKEIQVGAMDLAIAGRVNAVLFIFFRPQCPSVNIGDSTAFLRFLAFRLLN